MLQATATKIQWDPDKKQWRVRIEFGDEVIKRLLPKSPKDASEEDLRSLAVQTAKDEGYLVEAARVEITR
ncbi:MAG TPA: hypothetical protein VHD76_04245 [Bryobacteraceae bacterium]|jgi:hypothetical protein|nr:hypothetical protein [Bryobacteraceae bacterium]